MNLQIRSVDPTRHDLPRLLLSALCTSKAPTRITTFGKWKLPLGHAPIEDRPRPASFRRGELPKDLGLTLPHGVEGRCHNYFPDGGGMDWHTDSGSPGWRLYVFRCGPGRSTFYYCDRYFIEPGEGSYLFQIGENSWHAVESYRDRFSCGVSVPDYLAQEIIETASA